MKEVRQCNCVVLPTTQYQIYYDVYYELPTQFFHFPEICQISFHISLSESRKWKKKTKFLFLTKLHFTLVTIYIVRYTASPSFSSRQKYYLAGNNSVKPLGIKWSAKQLQSFGIKVVYVQNFSDKSDTTFVHLSQWRKAISCGVFLPVHRFKVPV